MTMQNSSLKLFAILLIAACAHINWAKAQNSIENKPKPVCTATRDITAPQLYGLWQVRFTNPPAGLPNAAVMLLKKHEEFSDSLSGIVSRVGVTASSHSAKAALAGDVEDGFVTLDESSNNVSISGTWNGHVVEGSCGREVKGVWKDTSVSALPDAAGAPDVTFTLIRLSGW